MNTTAGRWNTPHIWGHAATDDGDFEL